MTEISNNICFIPLGKEEEILKTFEGNLEVEKCNIFSKCDYIIEKFTIDDSTKNQNYVQLYYCRTSKLKSGLFFLFILIAIILFFKLKN
tara:strand:+ start:338 stop:604 length:267 start_codon:yes stop_codon:yes gene_type:complete